MCTIQKLDSKFRKIHQEEFNIVSWCGVGTTETKHSAMIADLLNPRGCHGCREIPLKRFLEIIDLTKVGDLFATSVETEVMIMDGARRVDILLENKDFAVIIENKTESSDNYNQLMDYADHLKREKGKGIENHQKRLVYLTYNENDKPNQPPDDGDSNGFRFCHQSYQKSIIGWLDEISKSYIPEETKIAVAHYSRFLQKLLNPEYADLRAKIIKWVQCNVNDAKRIITQDADSYSLDTVRSVYEELCQYYCEQLLKGQKIQKISVSKCSLKRGCSAPFRCTCSLENGKILEFFPLACSNRNYGKLYALDKDGNMIYGCLCDKKWNCNFYDWLDNPSTEIKECNIENGFCLEKCIAECMKTVS